MGKTKDEKVIIFEDKKIVAVIVKEYNDFPEFTEKEEKAIKFYTQTLGYEFKQIIEEPKKRKSFKVENAKKYISKHDKAKLKEFNALRKEADEAQKEYKNKKASGAAPAELKELKHESLKLSGSCYRAQQKWFKEVYDEDIYDEVSRM